MENLVSVIEFVSSPLPLTKQTSACQLTAVCISLPAIYAKPEGAHM